MKTEKWCDHEIRFIEVNGEWYAVLKDICDALNLRTFKVSQRLDPSMMERVQVEVSDIPSRYVRSPGENKTRWMLAVNEAGIYQALFASRKLEARKFQLWTFDILKKLRKSVGLEGYEVMRMTDPDIQEEIDWILDSLYWDEEKQCIMQSITIQGGDVDQVPFMSDEEEECDR